MTTPLSDFDIDAVATGLMACTLPKANWTHAAHWAAALWLIRSDTYDAERDMPGFIRAYNEATGTANTETSGYHETITRASLLIARRALKRSGPETPLSEVLERLISSPHGRSDWLMTHWSKTVLFSPLARRSWVPPDLKPL